MANPVAGPMPAGVVKQTNAAWRNYGGNLQTPVGALYVLTNGLTNDANVGLKAIVWAIREVGATGGSLSSSGARWSFSAAAVNTGAMIDIRAMAKKLGFNPSHLANPADAVSLVQVQGGTSIEQLIAYAEGAGRSLKAMGGNCGQTIAGAISTGTKGGFVDQQGFPDMVRALYLVGEDGSLFWLERGGARRVISDSMEAMLTAAHVKVVRDDALFNHAVVSLGAFGVIYAVVLETAPAYAVKLSRTRMDFDDALDAATFDNDFARIGAGRPLDFAAVINPYRMKETDGKWRGSGAAWVTQLFPMPTGTATTLGGPGVSLNDADLSNILATFASASPADIPGLMDLLIPVLYGGREAQGPFPVAYPLALTHAPTLGMEIAVSSTDARAMLGEILKYVHAAPKPIAGALSIRQTLKSEATLSAARWPRTFTFEWGCLAVPGTEELLAGLLDALEATGIPFALHLGQLVGNGWLTRARLDAMYGAEAVEAWVQGRKTTCPTGKVFGSQLTRALGLTP